MTTSFVDKASLSWTPKTDDDTWWIMSYAQMDTTSLTDKDFFNARLNIDSGSTIVSTSHIEGEDLADTPIYG